MNRLPEHTRQKRYFLLGVALLFALCLRADNQVYPPLLLQLAQQSQQPERYWAALLPQDPQLALAKLSQSTQLHWITLAAKHRNAYAQWQLSELTTDPQQRLMWLQKAAENEEPLAQNALYHHLKLTFPEEALRWLKRAATQDANSALLLAKEGWRQQDVTALKHWLVQAKHLGNMQAAEFLQALDFSQQYQGAEQGCQQPILAVTDSLAGLAKAQQFHQRLISDPRLQDLPVCFSGFVSLPKAQLKCMAQESQNGRLGCDNYLLAQRLANFQFSHIVVFANSGKANVVNGMMHLDSADSYDVFIHELAHFSGFIDEYPLSKTLAMQFCEEDGRYPNLLIRHTSSTDEIQDESQLVAARTCNNGSAQAYKTAESFTFMEFYDEGTIPADYITSWQRQLALPAKLTPAFINLAQASESAKDKPLADYWWQRLAHFRRQ
ncbi:hypothetical protein QX776_02390 [Alteromonadaceae bacterium BrNp21-10]|nr:hypothetical protein [Alteromonadaceae bacterium BrNp21-10]